MDMKILNLIGGGDVGGAKTHIISLASRLGYSCTVKIVSFRDGPFVEDTRAAGIDVEVVHNRTARADLKALERIVSEYKPDIIHCHGARANMMGVLLRRKVHLPLVTTIHSDYKLDYMGMPLKGMTFGLINRFCLRRIDYYTCVARRTARMMISRGFPAHHIFTIYNGIDFSTFRTLVDKREYLARFGQTYRDGDVLCGFAARLTAVKDVPTLLRAAAKACKQCPNLKIVIAGDGEDRQSLEALTASLGIRENVIFLGWIDDIHSFFAAMDINVICSLSETFPYSILEGIQERCATITSDVGGMPELIDSGVNGFIFPPGDDAALARHLVTLCESEELRKTFSDRLFDKASAHFSLDSMAKTQLSIYEAVLADRAHAYKRDGVLICGAYGKGNAGDDAILKAIVAQAQELDRQMPVCVMSRTPKKTAYAYGVNAIFTFDIPKMLRQMRARAVYINGGGSLIQDVTSSRSLLFYLYTLWAAHRKGAGVIMYGCGIGPVTRPRNRRRAAKILNSCVDVITLREDDSQNELSLLGVTKPRVCLAADPAMTLSAPDATHAFAALTAQGVPPEGKYLVLCVREWPGFAEKAPAIAAAANYAHKTYGLDTLILPVEVPRDLAAGEQIRMLLDHEPYIIRKRFEPELTIGIIAQAKAMLAMRLHALVFAVQAGIPCAGIVYDRKVAGFMHYIGEDMYVDLADTDEKTLCAFLDRMMNGSVEQRSENARRLRELEKVNRQELAKLIGEHRA